MTHSPVLDIAVSPDDIEDVAAATPPASRHAAGLVAFALAVGSFAFGTGEFAIMGLLPNIAEGLSVTTPEAGHVISAYALGVVVGAPVIAVLAARMTRRTLLLSLVVIYVAANLASAMVSGYASFAFFRFLSGLPHGAYFGIAALVAASMVPTNRRTQAVGKVMLGLTTATLIGTPLATFLGQVFGWRSLFVLVALVSMVTVVLLSIFLPRDKVTEGASAMRELGALRRTQVWLTLGISAVGFGGMFAVFTYVASTATEVAGLSVDFVPFLMAFFGSGMVAGNILGARFADRSLMGTIGGMMVLNVVVLAMFALTASSPVMLSLSIFLIGFGVAIGPALQTRLMDTAGDAQSLAASLVHSAFNTANALGAWLGGLSIAAGYGYASTGWVGAVLGLGGIGVFAASYALEQTRKRAALSVREPGCAPQAC